MSEPRNPRLQREFRTYDEWMKAVDRILLNTIGITTSDLPDFMSYDSWNDGSSPWEGAQEALDNDDMGFEL